MADAIVAFVLCATVAVVPMFFFPPALLLAVLIGTPVVLSLIVIPVAVIIQPRHNLSG